MLLLLLALQAGGPRPTLTASVDHAHVRVGDELTLSIQAKSNSTDPLTLLLPGLSGFTMVGSREATQVSFGSTGPGERVTLRELSLRAERPGRLVIGGIAVTQGSWRAKTAPIVVTVDSGVLATAVSAITRALLASAPPPSKTDQVSLTLVASRDSAWPGSQLDVVAAAWFPRTVRNQLTRDPLLTLPTPVGAWGYPPDGPAGVATSRQVHGTWMDLYVLHQTLFPLASGRLALPPATLEYALPVSASILTREERYELSSDSLVIAVPPLPAEGRPYDDRGVVGHGLSLTVTTDSAPARVGEPMQVTATVAGTGNVTLWPAPVIAWPPSLHAYPGEEDTQIESRDGTVAGTKTIRYLVVPDSSGSVVLPEIRYPYFDPGARAYAVSTVPPRVIPVGAGMGLAAARQNLPLLAPRGPAWAPFFMEAAWPWGWLAIALVPPFVGLLGVIIRRARSARRTPAPVRAWGTRLGRLERDFQDLLVAYVSDAEARDGDALATALRSAGLEHAVAGHVVRLRDRLRAARYGPQGAADQAELAEELTQVLKVLGGEPAGAGGRRHVRVMATLALVFLAPQARGQSPSPEALYHAGAVRSAADAFAARVARHPDDAAAWYNLGAASYREGADGKAVAAWAEAARLAPRDATIRQARAILAPPDLATEDLLSAGPLTRAEWAVLAGLVWVAWWGSVLLRRPRLKLSFGLALVVVVGTGAYEWWRLSRPVVVVVEGPAPVRSAPFGEASAASSLPAGAAGLVVKTYAGWVEVERPDGVRGWILQSEVMRL